jgi:hypothetical protein
LGFDVRAGVLEDVRFARVGALLTDAGISFSSTFRVPISEPGVSYRLTAVAGRSIAILRVSSVTFHRPEYRYESLNRWQ